MQTFTFCSFKGGTAKTSTSLHIGDCLSRMYNKKILLVDVDSQANLSFGLGIHSNNVSSLVPVLQKNLSIESIIQKTSIPRLSIISANVSLDGIEKTPQVGNDPLAYQRLSNALRTIKNEFDYCFIDTPPNLGWLTQSAFFASQHIVICVIPEAYSLIALHRLREFHNSVCQYHQTDIFGVILSFWDDRGAINQEIITEIQKVFNNKVFSSKIRRDMTVSRAVFKGQTVFEYNKKSRAATDYTNLSREFLSRIDNTK